VGFLCSWEEEQEEEDETRALRGGRG